MGDLIPEELTAMGAQGAVIEKAREAVTVILEQNNSCSAWLRQKDSDPAASFRRIHFRIDENGQKYAQKLQAKNGAWFYLEPYAANVIQKANPPVWITLNSGGAFFKSAAAMRSFYNDGTPAGIVTAKRLNIEIYTGASLEAQIIILLHELAHVLDVIPPDGAAANMELSAKNTVQVLHFCRAQVESAAKKK